MTLAFMHFCTFLTIQGKIVPANFVLFQIVLFWMERPVKKKNILFSMFLGIYYIHIFAFDLMVQTCSIDVGTFFGATFFHF